MGTLLSWAIWALVISLSMADDAVKPVEWVDLMIATSNFPRFFGTPPHVSRKGGPKVTAVTLYDDPKKPRFGKDQKVLPIQCSSKSGDSCKGAEMGQGVKDAISALQENIKPPSLGDGKPGLEGLNFIFDHMRYFWYDHTGSPHHHNVYYFRQSMHENLPVDNTELVLEVNQWIQNGSYWAPFKVDQHQIYYGEFDPINPMDLRCSQFHARDTASQLAMKQPFWSALDAPEYELVYTVQDGSLYLTWRLKFDLQKQVGDDFWVWVNARNCSEVIAAAPGKMNPHTSSLSHFQKEQRKLFDERGIPLEGHKLE
ncbi:hypothetical protein KVR01_006259 [Diaporthe batatas]|uniref:uncharacterized protein n=1 Tax=Diaporthe batatas TaxID=748121 RepID=UPI001D059B23|nr:uncharacterized protein KVR01_006259 [Diaporthe batatas]KAG8164341.1 hypothetical protein KVR01_006259 [Diaporthe batatas]